MKVTPIRMRRPVNEARGVDIVAGAALSSVILAPLVAVSSTTAFMATSRAEPLWVLIWLICWFVGALTIGFFVSILWGVPMAFLVARLARRSEDWRIFLASYTGLGALTGALVWFVGGLASGSNRFPEILPGDQIPWMLATAAITAVSTASGWASIWCASRAEPELVIRIDEDSRAIVEEARA